MRCKWLVVFLALAACDKTPTLTSSSTPSPKSKKADLELQEQCAKQAREEFQRVGWSNDDTQLTNHYNEKLNRCFMLIEKYDPRATGVLWRTKVLTDAYEGKTIGLFVWHSEKDKKYWEVPPFQCEMTPPSGEKTFCKSEEEFDEFVKTYME